MNVLQGLPDELQAGGSKIQLHNHSSPPDSESLSAGSPTRQLMHKERLVHSLQSTPAYGEHLGSLQAGYVWAVT